MTGAVCTCPAEDPEHADNCPQWLADVERLGPLPPSESDTLTWLRREHARLIRKVDALEAIRVYVRDKLQGRPPDALTALHEAYEAAVRDD